MLSCAPRTFWSVKYVIALVSRTLTEFLTGKGFVTQGVALGRNWRTPSAFKTVAPNDSSSN